MDHPFQAIAHYRPESFVWGADSYFIAACGPYLFSVATKAGSFGGSGEIRTKWSAAAESAEADAKEPELKKRRTDGNSSEGPVIIKLVLDEIYGYLVAVTDDKCLRVFQIGEQGELTQLSQRFMPKRPCAVTIMGATETIICGDKFGDVYALPLHPSESDDSTNDETNGKPEPKLYKPAATETTVHTLRNRKALEEQMRAVGRPTKTKEPLAFEHTLLLGHVSMLTDMVCLPENDCHASYIITCDRDEHIRVSRGIPQTHIIESFCMGHTEFVSKLCTVMVGRKRILLSGGGDDWMGVWDWESGELVVKHDLRGLLKRSNDKDGVPRTRVAVQHIWAVPSEIGKPHLIVVKAEGSPSLAVLEYPEIESSNAQVQIIHNEEVGEIVDLFPDGEGKAIVSKDGAPRIQVVRFKKSEGTWSLVQDKAMSKVFKHINAEQVARPQDAKLDWLFNSIEKLRKQDFDEDQQE